MTPRDTTQATQNQDRRITETRPRYQRDMAECMNFSILKHHPSTYGPQLHWFAQKGAQYSNSNWNFRFCLETRSKCSSMFISLSPKNQNTITKAQKNSTATSTAQHQAITHSSSKHHSTITTHQGNLTETCPRRHQHITERSPKHHQKANKTTPKQHRDIAKKRQRQDRDITETSPKTHRDITETRQRQDQDKTETRPRHDRDITETSPRQDRDKTKTRPRQGSIIRRHTGHSILPQLHWFAQRSTIYKFKLEF